MRPILNSPKKMIINPAILVRKEIFVDSNAPTHVAEAPRRINTPEKPAIKNIELRTTESFFLFNSAEPLLLSFISCRETPDINETYPGTRGRTHGDKNDKIPAANAIHMVMS
jgi:hypothetical protein